MLYNEIAEINNMEASEMIKNSLIAALCIGIILETYFLASRLTVPAKPAISSSHMIPTVSLEKRICERVSAQFGDCKKILLYDTTSNLVFAESSSGIIPVLTNSDFTEFKKLIYPMMDFQEFKEEKEERGPIDWRVKNNVQKDLSIIYGFADDKAKTIVINSEGNIQPNRFFVRDHLWVWYVTLHNHKVKLPIKVTVYDADGQTIK